ncbi:peptidyl-prolyl cis-trans isomerase [Steroidobacter sp. S1-65]|uniref:peptidylprolyl isomerase n=1 Tax=Steroidobacter gossypii TaxID=2805490 RepID=A0ABS1X024_9GAMM|nr:peptidylprolyl isomerase [Steroidobacter gossypii]MBM0106590.1 peptidyl-prolyl cis-trans isomerase [Steroidobacter gossypii]
MSTDEFNERAERGAKAMLTRAMREPLLQFLSIALVLFVANQLIHGSSVQISTELITISRGRVNQLAESYRLLTGRLPSRAELQALVDDFADEEIAYREAIAMGLDADDTIVRRRMRQKLEFLAEEAEASEEPTDEQLAGWLAEHAADYRLPERISFRQVMASADVHGARMNEEAAALLKQLRSGADASRLGDPSMLPSTLPSTTHQGVTALFGETFADAIFAHTGEGWFGPIVTPLGAHLISVLKREPARTMELAEIRGKLRSDWIEARRRDQREQFLARLRQRYSVAVEWPEMYLAQPAASDVSKIRHPLDTIHTSGE